MKFTFADQVVVEERFMGVVLKCWGSKTYEVYVRSWNDIRSYREDELERYLVRHKELDEEEMEYQATILSN